MSDPAKGNIVSLDNFGTQRSGVGAGPGARALRTVRDNAIAGLEKQVGHLMEKVDDALFARAEKAENNNAQTRYFDAMRELRIIRTDIETDFLKGFTARFNQGMPRAGNASDPFRLDTAKEPSSLALVSDCDLEEDLAINNMMAKIRSSCARNLGDLDKRMGLLLRDPELEKWHNPLGPEAICESFREAAKRIETGLEIRLVIFKLFDQHVIANLNELYTEINQQLIQMGVMPEIRVSIRKSLPSAQIYHTPHPPQAAGIQAGTENHPTYTSASGGQSPGYGQYAGSGAFIETGGQLPINTLTMLQQGHFATGGTDPGFDMGPGLVSGQVNILHKIRQLPPMQSLQARGDTTLDMVAMLFDYILDDKAIPDQVRALIGRLQIPILKVALLDREFFSRKSHPARQLLNRLATTANGWQEHSDKDPLYRKIDSIVQTLLDKFEHDIHLFQLALDELDSFLHQHEQRAEARAKLSAKVMEKQEKLDTAEACARDEIEARLSAGIKPEFVSEFLSTYWKNLLFFIHARQGRECAAWQQALATMDNLIWSVQPKQSGSDRNRLAEIWPQLLNELRIGMERLPVPHNDRDEFLARLTAAHIRVITDTAPSSTQVQEPDSNNSPHTIIPTENRVSAVATQKGSAQRTDVHQGAPDTTDDLKLDQVRRLKTGTWMDFRDSKGGTSTRAKLSWISPITNTYLFTDCKGMKAGNYSIEELARLMQISRARVAREETPLMDRAVSAVLDSLQVR